VRKSLVAVLLIAWLRTAVVAGPGTPGSPPYDPDATARAPGGSDQRPSGDPGKGPSDDPHGNRQNRQDDRYKDSPWIDLAPSKVFARRGPPEGPDGPQNHKLAAGLTQAGLYAGFSGWTYFAWYRKGCRPEPKPCSDFLWGKDGSFGATTYAGGADKLGHAWATLALGRLGTEMLYQWGGYERRASILVGTALSEALFLGVEIRDGFTYQFSYWDFAFDTIGAGLALAQSLWPRFDELIDLRVQYWPSQAYRDQLEGGNVNIAEDYSGETYLLALHLGALPGLRGARWAGWSRFVDVAVGFETRGYKPEPPYMVDPEDPTKQDYPRRQTLFLGVTLNAQGAFDRLLDRRAPRLRKVTHGLFEMFNLPFTTLPVLDGTRRPEGPVDMDGA
jgi:hypothetical protein